MAPAGGIRAPSFYTGEDIENNVLPSPSNVHDEDGISRLRIHVDQ